MRLPKVTNVEPVEGHGAEGKSRESPTGHEYDVLMLAALHQLALPHRTNAPLLLKHDRQERFGRRTKKSTTLLVLGGSLSK